MCCRYTTVSKMNAGKLRSWFAGFEPAPFGSIPFDNPTPSARGASRRNRTALPVYETGAFPEGVERQCRPEGRRCYLVLENSPITDGVAVSNPTTSSIPASFGSAMVKPFDTIPTMISFAGMPVRCRYSRSACDG